MARRLLQRIDSDEPLKDVIVDVLDSVNQLADGDLVELLTAIGRRHHRDRATGRVPPDSPDSPDSPGSARRQR